MVLVRHVVFRFKKNNLASQKKWGSVRGLDPSATLGRAFSPDEAVAGTSATPYVSSMLLVRIRMINFILRLPVPAKFSLSVRCTWQAPTGFRRVGESDCPALLHLRLDFMLES